MSLVSSILYDSLEALRIASILLWPIMPERMEIFWNAISINEKMASVVAGGLGKPSEILQWGQLSTGSSINELSPLFPRVDPLIKSVNTKTQV